MCLGVEDGQVPYDTIGCVVNSGYPTAATAAAPRFILPRAELYTDPKWLPTSRR